MREFLSIEILLALFILLQVLDVVSTREGLRLGARESNRVISWLMNNTGDLWIVVKLAIGALPIAAHIHDSTFFAGQLYWVLLLLSALYIYVIVSNYRVIKRLKGRRR